jgi:hypothetical protein
MKKFEVNFTGFEVRKPIWNSGSINVCFFTNLSDAQKCAESIPGGDVREVNCNHTWTVYDSYDEYVTDPIRKQQRKEEALAKLTTDEKQLLGLL